MEKGWELKLIKLFEVENKSVSDHFVYHVVVFYWDIVLVEYYIRVGA